MKLKLRLKTALIILCLIAISGNTSFAQGLYQEKDASSTETGAPKGAAAEPGLYDAPGLRAGGPPGGNPEEPGQIDPNAPISDAVWVLIILSGIYGVYCYKRKEENA